MKLKWNAVLVAALGLSLAACSAPDENERLAKQGLPPADFVGSAEQGRDIYVANCAACHGRFLKGGRTGPPLLHNVYEPSHHSNLAFYRAVKDGTKAHHWQFGDMPPQPQVSPTDAAHIIAYIRDRQRRVGIN